MNRSFKLAAVSAAVIGCLATYPTIAQESQENKNVDSQEEQSSKKVTDESQDMEVITVKGFRGSLQKAINGKRFSDGVTDQIHAEDVGKSTDQNIADALSRVTGVTVQESDGEGTKISVRGAGANLNQISMNGVALTSGLGGTADNPVAEQGVDLSAFSSDILSSIVVQKTSAADQNEGSLGANVVLKTVKPLDLKKPKRNIEIQQRYNEFAREGDNKFSFSLSDKFFDETFGVIVTATDETQHTRKDEYKAAWHEASTFIPDGRARDAETGKIIRIADPSLDTADFNPSESIENFDPDKEIINFGDLYALTMSDASQALNLNERNRQSVSIGLQYAPSDSTDIQLDLSHSQQDIFEDKQNYNVQFGITDVNKATDPQQDWWTVDRESQTMTKRYARQAKGRSFRNVGGNEQNTNIATLNVEQWLTDDLKVSVLAGYSRTKSKSKDNVGLLMVPNGVTISSIDNIPLTSDDPNQITLEPGGYDCTSGTCSIDIATQLSQIVPGETNEFNQAPGLTNILDPNLFYVRNLTKYDNRNSDVNKSLFLDFDWAVDFSGIRSFEFGTKYSKRIKDVNTQKDTFSDGSVIFNSDGEEVSVNGISSISTSDIISDKPFQVDDFLDGIVAGHDQEYLQGWPSVDPFKALELVTPSSGSGGKDVNLKIDNSGSRIVEQEVKAAYAKVNFEFYDGRLTGNLGLRYVETNTYAEAYSRIQYQNGSNTYDPYQLLEYADLSKPQCAEPVWHQLPGGGPDKNSYAANHQQAGTCSLYQLTHLFNIKDDSTRLAGPGETVDPAQLDSNNEDYILQVIWDNGTPIIIRNDGNPNGNNGRFSTTQEIKALADRSTNEKLVYNRNGQLVNGGSAFGTLANQRPFLSTGESTNRVLLPSLNLNYQVNDELIARFSATKTMARPKFDSTTPGGRINENGFEQRGNGKINNVALEPLESINLDLSLEWYFNDSGLFSMAFFHKKMTNFEETVNEVFLWKDLRTNYSLDGINSLDDILINPNQTVDADDNPVVDEKTGLQEWEETPLNSECMPDRMMHRQLREALTLNCHALNIDVVRNGKGAVTKGVELTYNQNFDFLPGFFSGFGTSINYTFADSESDAETSITTGQAIKPLPQPFTPKHSANVTVFWEKDGAMLRLASRYNSTQLVSRGLTSGASWLDDTMRLDLSASYELTDNISINFQALNLTDDTNRIYYTSTRTVMGVLPDGTPIVFDEGNSIDGDGNKSRTLSEYRTGRQYRLGIRATF